MSERGDALRQAMMDRDMDWAECSDPHDTEMGAIARAICEHLGITWGDVELVEMWIDAKKHSDQLMGFVGRMERHRDRIATLLEAAGIER